jgi:hypothetical protein
MVTIIVAAALAGVVAAAVRATPGSEFSTTPLVRSTAAVRLNVRRQDACTRVERRAIRRGDPGAAQMDCAPRLRMLRARAKLVTFARGAVSVSSDISDARHPKCLHIQEENNLWSATTP